MCICFERACCEEEEEEEEANEANVDEEENTFSRERQVLSSWRSVSCRSIDKKEAPEPFGLPSRAARPNRHHHLAWRALIKSADVSNNDDSTRRSFASSLSS